MLKWSEAETVSALGVLPEVGDHGISHRFVVSSNGVSLVLLLSQYDADIQVELVQDGSDHVLVRATYLGAAELRHRSDKRGEYLEIIPVSRGSSACTLGAHPAPWVRMSPDETAP